MATTTTNFGLKKYEGTDLFNPLTFENPNTDDIDAAMFYNKQHNCVDATELTTGTVHAIIKADLDSPLFSFSATSVYHYGDTFTLNGTPVTALLTSGEVLPEGAYVIGSRVLGFISGGGSLITFYVMKTTDLTPINSIIGNTDISGIGDGTLTGAVDSLNDELSQLTIKTETQNVTASAVGSFTITKPTGAKAFWVIDTDKYASCYFVRYREHVYGIFGFGAPHEPYQGPLTVTVQYI